MTGQPRDEVSRYDRLSPAARTLLENHDELDLAEMLAQAEAELRRYTEAESADAAAGSYAHRAEHADAAIERVQQLLNTRQVGCCAHLIRTALAEPKDPTP